MSDNKSYNIMALRGVPIDDMEYVKDFGLDESVAYTPQINEVMLTKIHDENLEFYRSEGMSEKAAREKAGKYRRDAKRNIDKLIKKNKM